MIVVALARECVCQWTLRLRVCVCFYWEHSGLTNGGWAPTTLWNTCLFLNNHQISVFYRALSVMYKEFYRIRFLTYFVLCFRIILKGFLIFLLQEKILKWCWLWKQKKEKKEKKENVKYVVYKSPTYAVPMATGFYTRKAVWIWVTLDAYTVYQCLKVWMTPAAGRFDNISLNLSRL